MRYYDINGWLTETVLPDRATDVEPPSEPLPEGHRWNFTGYVWVAQRYAAAPALQGDELIESVKAEVQARLDAFAQERGYDNILSAVSYVGDPVAKFAAKGARARELRGACWATCYNILTAVQGGDRAMPTVNEVLAELPALTWE